MAMKDAIEYAAEKVIQDNNNTQKMKQKMKEEKKKRLGGQTGSK
jgi:hypothetical protein